MPAFADRYDDEATTKRLSGDEQTALIVAKLEEDIVFGRLQPRERLIEEELATRFDAKRHVVRSAIVELQRLGLVERVANRGAVVRLYAAGEVEEINEVRELLETYAASLIPLPLAADAVRELEDIQQRHAKAVDEQDRKGVFRLNLDFHRTLFAHCGNGTLFDEINSLAQKSHAYRSILTTDTVYLRWAANAHGEMVEALRVGDREALVRLCREHLAPAKDRYIETWRSRFA